LAQRNSKVKKSTKTEGYNCVNVIITRYAHTLWVKYNLPYLAVKSQASLAGPEITFSKRNCYHRNHLLQYLKNLPFFTHSLFGQCVSFDSQKK